MPQTTLLRKSDVLALLAQANDAMLQQGTANQDDIVSLGMVRAVNIADSGALSVRIEIPPDAAASGAADRLRDTCLSLLSEPASLPWVSAVDVSVQIAPPIEAPAASDTRPLQALADSQSVRDVVSSDAAVAPGVSQVAHIVAVASCKGGVGKSTTAVNLAYALSAGGARVGLVDLDIHGPSLPTMVRVSSSLEINDEMLLPFDAHGVKLMSMGYINPGVMPLRGAKVTPLVQQLVGRTAWGELDYLIVDMPPGTGDVQLTLSQEFRVSAAVLVTTPQRLSFVDVVKGVEMFDKVGIPTVAVVENMAGLAGLGDLDGELARFGERHALPAVALDELRELLAAPRALFGDSHVRRVKEMWGIEAAFAMPLRPELAAAADDGVPTVVAEPSGEAAGVYRELAGALQAEMAALGDRQRPELFFSGEEQRILVVHDGREQSLSPAELRSKCRSPSNRPDALPADLYPLDFVPMGSYAVSVRWSDGHQSLIPYSSFVHGYA